MFFKSLWPALLWALFILIICGIPGHRLPHVNFWQWLKPDKVVHLFVYAILSYLLIRGFIKQKKFSGLKNSPGLSAVIFSIFYGVLIEVLQEYVFIDRSGEFFDALANSIGALIGLLCFNYLAKRRSLRKTPTS
jgi:VanZ family protein